MDSLIHANTCFTLACHSDGLEGVMQVLQQQLHQCISAGDFMALVHLYIGLHRFDECEFILDALADSDQFELILSVSPYQLHFTVNANLSTEVCDTFGRDFYRRIEAGANCICIAPISRSHGATHAHLTSICHQPRHRRGSTHRGTEAIGSMETSCSECARVGAKPRTIPSEAGLGHHAIAPETYHYPHTTSTVCRCARRSRSLLGDAGLCAITITMGLLV